MNEELSKWRVTQVCNAFDAAIKETKAFIVARLITLFVCVVIGIIVVIWEMSELDQILDGQPANIKPHTRTCFGIGGVVVFLSMGCNLICLKHLDNFLRLLIPRNPLPDTENDPALKLFQEVISDIRKIKKYLLINWIITIVPLIAGSTTAMMTFAEVDLRKWLWIGVGLLVFVYVVSIVLWIVIRKYHSKLKKWGEKNGEMFSSYKLKTE